MSVIDVNNVTVNTLQQLLARKADRQIVTGSDYGEEACLKGAGK